MDRVNSGSGGGPYGSPLDVGRAYELCGSACPDTKAAWETTEVAVGDSACGMSTVQCGATIASRGMNFYAMPSEEAAPHRRLPKPEDPLEL